MRALVVAAALASVPAFAGVQLSPATLDFGPQSMGTTSPALTVTVTNAGPGPVTVVSATTTTAQFKPSHSCATLAEGASCAVHVVFTPAPAAGDLESQVLIEGGLTVETSAGSQAAALAGLAQKSLVAHFYRSILGRFPDAGGAQYWRNEALRFQGLAANPNEVWYAMSAFFLSSAEYVGFNRNDTGFLNDLYRTFFNRDPDAGGMVFWLDQLAQGMPREIVVNEFMFSTEFRGFSEALFGNAPSRAENDIVMDLYRGMLARLPDETGFIGWTAQLRSLQCTSANAAQMRAEAAAAAAVFAVEHRARGRTNAQYVADLYNAILRRGGDLQGVRYWIEQLDTNARTRDQLRDEFLGGSEYGARAEALASAGCLSHGKESVVADGDSPSVMIGDDDVPIVAFRRHYTWYVARCGDAECTNVSSAVPLDSFGGGYGRAQVTRGAAGLPVVFYTSWDQMNVAQCDDAACNGTIRRTVLDADASLIPAFSALAAGGDGMPIVVQVRDRGPQGLRFAKCTTLDCAGTGSQLAPELASDRPPSMALGGDGLPFVGFSQAGLRTARCNDAACAGRTLASIAGPAPEGISVAMGADGLPAIAVGSALERSVRYLRCGTADCNGAVASSVVLPYAGANTVLQALSADGRPTLVTSDSSTYGFKVVRCGNASCTTGNVVNTIGGPHVARWPNLGSLALRADGRPVIAYMEYVGGSTVTPQVRLLSCANVSCSPH